MKKLFNKTLSILLTMAIVLSLFAGMGTVAFAASNPNFSKVADAPTLDGWRNFFGTTFTSSENAGGVWTDKSVFADNSYFTGLTDAYNNPIIPEVADDSFLVALINLLLAIHIFQPTQFSFLIFRALWDRALGALITIMR